ncbi:MAG: 6-pyruvoyl-tetrahydropterin synthase-related protein, partial [Candidatus Margulisbacteria bacterium]|nr:6-pyruvoyl-tetrahydropterin synthase-related protein [Candidatus Margulisiibacteriota bacterium]
MKKNNLIDLIVLIGIFLFLFSFFEPRYLFSVTTTTGGDTVSHFPTAVYLKEVLLPHGRLMGWDQGNYAGYPIFYHYFPLTFIFMVILSYLIPIQIAFKIITVLGTFFLPICVYLAFRLLRYPFPIPVMGATFSLAFLFMQANSMWGGNIPSTLAGEYSYSFGLAMVIVFFGTLYRGVEEK